MIKVGLTGGIGSGKTIVSKIFEYLGVPIYNSDYEAKKLYVTNIEVKEKIVNYFGSKAYFENGELNKKLISEIIFKNTEALKKINSIIHPEVKNHFNNWLKNQKTTYIIKEAAILYESGAYKHLDKVIVVTAPEKIRIKRVMKRDNTDKNSVKGRIKNQLNQKEILKISDFEIKNNEEEMVLKQVLEIHKQLNN